MTDSERTITISPAAYEELCTLLGRYADEGLPFDAFDRDLALHVEQHDWWWFRANKIERRQRSLALYKAYCATRYAEGREAQLRDQMWPFWVFISGPGCPQTHGALNGVTLPPMDMFWLTHRPPLDWNCACYLLGASSERAARRLGGVPERVLTADLLRDVRGTLWQSNERPSILHLLGAIVNGELG